ncbi:unnamed protein product [Blepharisma stoltei]|uniref:Uncharacterized protein n=1 Tax=Blepharisma stoltei TaxID=1481888 RepID=A0AAU9IT99_9CILI|nr:unnamed protein product [Blepharisma stoltei]
MHCKAYVGKIWFWNNEGVCGAIDQLYFYNDFFYVLFRWFFRSCRLYLDLLHYWCANLWGLSYYWCSTYSW